MKRLALSALLLATTASLVALANAMPAKQGLPPAPERLLIRPGKGVGKVWLGASRHTVRQILGIPKASEVRKDGVIVDEWLGPSVKSDAGWSVARKRLAVLFRHDRAVQIELNSASYVTADGVSINSSLATFRKYYRPRLRSYLYLDDGGGGYRGYVYDDPKRGLAFTFGAQDNYDATIRPETLRVHHPGIAALPDPGGKPTVTHDEIPARKKPN